MPIITEKGLAGRLGEEVFITSTKGRRFEGDLCFVTGYCVRPKGKLKTFRYIMDRDYIGLKTKYSQREGHYFLDYEFKAKT